MTSAQVSGSIGFAESRADPFWFGEGRVGKLATLSALFAVRTVPTAPPRLAAALTPRAGRAKGAFEPGMARLSTAVEQLEALWWASMESDRSSTPGRRAKLLSSGQSCGLRGQAVQETLVTPMSPARVSGLPARLSRLPYDLADVADRLVAIRRSKGRMNQPWMPPKPVGRLINVTVL